MGVGEGREKKGTRGIGGVGGGRGVGRRRKGESGEQAGPLPTPTCSTVCHVNIFGIVSRCTGLVLVERPRIGMFLFFCFVFA